MTRFRRREGGGSGSLVAVTLDDTDAALLQQVMAEMVELVRGEVAGEPDPAVAQDGQGWARELGLVDSAPAAVPPADPVTARLFPDGYRDDADAAGEFRRFTEAELRAVKTTHAYALLRSLPDGGGEVLLDDDLTAAWLGGLNDARLALGTALGVDQDLDLQDLDLDPDDLDVGTVQGQRLMIYGWLGYVQSALLDVLMDGDVMDGDD